VEAAGHGDVVLLVSRGEPGIGIDLLALEASRQRGKRHEPHKAGQEAARLAHLSSLLSLPGRTTNGMLLPSSKDLPEAANLCAPISVEIRSILSRDHFALIYSPQKVRSGGRYCISFSRSFKGFLTLPDVRPRAMRKR
jgi:hypothetical protein